jgi:hypothetical protein
VPPSRLLDVSAEIDRLYQLPLAEFVAERNALAARVKAEQGKEAADHIRTLAKPGLTAWVVNQLYWRYRQEFMALVEAGDALRFAQQARLAGEDADLTAAVDARRLALDALLAHGADLLTSAGHAPSHELKQRLSTTLEALATYGKGEGSPRAGRLTHDVDPPGFAALSALLPADIPESRPPAPPARTGTSAPQPTLAVVRRRDDEKLRTALASAEADVERLQRESAQAAVAVTNAEQALDVERACLAEAQRALDGAMAREQAAQAERNRARRAHAEARAALERAERTRDANKRALEKR